jgi:hypothetical protein
MTKNESDVPNQGEEEINVFKPWFSTWARVARGEEKKVGITNANTTLFCVPEHKVGKIVSSTPFVNSYNVLVPCS